MQTWLNLQDKIIIVTGGASGIGLAIVEELLAQGANVQMVDIHGGDGQYESHKGYQFWPTDISSAKEINHTVAEIIQRFGRIDGLVNNAGVNFPRLLVDEKAPAGQYELNEAAFEKNARVEAVEFVPGENAGDIVAKLEKLVSIHNQDEWLIAVDLQCGSPWNAAAMLAMRNPRLRVISGLSLPLALELVDNQDSMNIDELCEHLTQIAKQTCVVWRQVATAEEDF